jgi:hypothetical protein
MICATFQWTGKYPILIIFLHIAVSWQCLFLAFLSIFSL